MQKFFYIGLAGLIIFEILNVYFIMPMPGSQQINSIDVAYFLYSWRWLFRTAFVAMILLGFLSAFSAKRKWIPVIGLVLVAVIIYLFNFIMAADRMFLQPENLVLSTQSENTIPGNRLVVGVTHNGEAKAYPISFIAYHHQVVDTVGGMPVMVTYCSVCRTGRVFQPMVNGKPETFRLVGMDHFNAMFEDKSTGSWWRQTTGEAIKGEHKGEKLPEVPSQQMTVDKWFQLYPTGLVMQADKASLKSYDTLAKYEQGKSMGNLTRTNSLSWKDKSWVIGIQIGNESKAYDWNLLKEDRVINDKLGNTKLVIALSKDGQSFAAFERPTGNHFTINGDEQLMSDSVSYNFAGHHEVIASQKLKPIKAYQEFWHSWKTFHPQTKQYVKE